MPAATHQVHLSEPLNAFVYEQAENSGYDSPADFIQNLLEEARLEKAYQAEIDAKIQEAIHSERPKHKITPEFWEARRARLEERFAQTQEEVK